MSEDATNQQYPEEVRFDMDASDLESVKKYFRNRLAQLLAAGEDIKLKNWELLDNWGVRIGLVRINEGKEQEMHSVYVFKDHRGKRHFPEWIINNKEKIIFTVPDCELEAFLKKQGIQYVVATKPDFPEYRWIEQFYGDKKARRSGVHLMNHIDEGLYILHLYGASYLAKRSYALHPLLQGDAELRAFWDDTSKISEVDRRVLLLAAEYRNIANSYLSQMPSRNEITLSPLDDVNTMLIADKIQNRKDYELYHKDIHPRSNRLAEYFSQWLNVLGISEERYQEIKKDLLDRLQPSMLS